MVDFPHGAVDVVSEQGLREAVSRLLAFPELAVDVEYDAMHAFRARLCFVQMANDQDLFLVDGLAPGMVLGPLVSLFADPQKVKFFHAAGGDLQYLAEAGIRVKGLFDTHRAATLLGWQKVGLADLVRERLQIELIKDHQQSDFSVRPLPPEMRAYIADDVRYLSEIGRQVRDECRKADILEEVELDCARLADEAAHRPEIGSDFRPKIPRSGLSSNLVALALAITEEIHALRLKWAEAANVPMGRMLSNTALTEIALRPPTNARELAKLKGVRGAFVREYGEEVLGRIASLREKAARGELKQEAKKTGPDAAQRKRSETLRGWRAEKAKERKVTPSVVLSNALVDELAAKPPEAMEVLQRWPYLGEKRARIYGPELLALLNR